MIVKKSTLAFCSSNNLHATLSSSSTSITSYPSSTVRRRTGTSDTQCQNIRRYATVSDDIRRPRKQQEQTIPKWPAKPNPTPYDIFNQVKNAPYNKAAYYKLAKVYHPDTHHHAVSQDPISQATRLERYRLIVAAHSILSDPAKRHAYDLFGAGWHLSDDPTGGNRHRYAEADKSWREKPGNPAHNGTWEDWEAWRNARDGRGPPQQQVYMSNTMFAGVVMIFVAIGGAGQSARAEKSTTRLVEAKEQQHEHVSAELRRRKAELAMVSREGRVDRFLKDREGWPGADSPG